MDGRVLVAEDDEGIRMTLKFMLEDEGLDVLFAEDGEKALSMSRAERPDVILLDHHMPKMDGIQVLEALQQDPATQSIPVLILSGDSRVPPQGWRGARFVGKPFHPDDLVDRIRQALEG